MNADMRGAFRGSRILSLFHTKRITVKFLVERLVSVLLYRVFYSCGCVEEFLCDQIETLDMPVVVPYFKPLRDSNSNGSMQAAFKRPPKHGTQKPRVRKKHLKKLA